MDHIGIVLLLGCIAGLMLVGVWFPYLMRFLLP